MKSQNKKNEELQSRRQFFRKAAKGALPILGAIALSNIPTNLLASSTTVCPGCGSSCKNNCTKPCKSNCAGMCTDNCRALSVYNRRRK